MRKSMLSLLVGLSIGAAASAPAVASPTQETLPAARLAAPLPSDALTEEAIKGRIADAGYKEVKGLEFRGGVWRTKARGGNDEWANLTVGPVTGKVYPEDAPSRLNADEIRAKLAAAGYQNVSDVEFNDGLWTVDADNAAGKDVDLLVDPDDGSVVAEQQD